MYTVPDGLRITRNDDGGVVLDIDHGQMFRLNPVGALILESLDRGWAETEITLQIAREYNISEATAITDVREFLQALEGYKLVRREQEKRLS